MTDSLLERRQFPEDFPPDVVKVINTMTLNRQQGLELLGSASFKALKYSQDYDLYQKLNVNKPTNDEAVTFYVTELKLCIKKLLDAHDIYIGDIKCGMVKDWEVIPYSAMIRNGKIENYSYIRAMEKLDELKSKNVITPKEFKEAKKLIKPKPTLHEFLIMKDSVKFQTIRWKPKNIKDGYVYYRNKRIELRDALQTEGITKVDVVAFVQCGYHDFSCIYEFRNNCDRLDTFVLDIELSLKNDILYLDYEKRYFKLAKRMYSLAYIRKSISLIKALQIVLNDDEMGSMYVVMGDIGTLLWVLQNESKIPKARIKYEVQKFIPKIKDLEGLKKKLKPTKAIKIIDVLVKSNTLSRESMEDELTALMEMISDAVNDQAREVLRKKKLLPINSFYLP